MKHFQVGSVAVLAVVLAISGCSKKSTDQASISGTGFDSLSASEELAQLPQASTANQQAAVEALPIEVAPVTQAAPLAPTPIAALPTVDAALTSLSHEQKIQTALKNAGLYSGSIDGKIGPASRRAIEAFQRDHSLKVDGKVGPKTWAALETYLTGQTGSADATAAATTVSLDS